MRKLFETADRDAAHAKLAEVLADYPTAECREDPSAEEPYQVWSEPTPESRVTHVAPAPPDEDAAVDALLDKLLARLEKRGIK